MKTRMLSILAAVLMIATLSACGLSYQGLNLPGSGVSGSTYRLSAQFADVLNLANGAPVKMGGLTIGDVRDVRTDGMQAIADLDIQTAFKVPVGSTARLRYDTPLGQMFVQFIASNNAADLAPNATIPDTSTQTAPTVEDTLAEASLLINGGGLSQLQTINQELNTALDGRQGTVRELFTQATTFLRGANGGARDITAALVALDHAASALNARRRVFGTAIAAIQPAAKTLTEDTPLLTSLLAKTGSLTGQANRLFAATQTSLVSIVDQLGPILDQVIVSTPNYLHGSQELARVAAILPILIPGDFAPLNITMTLALQRLIQTPSGSSSGGGGSTGSGLPNLGSLLGGTSGTSSSPLGGLLNGLLGSK